MFCFHVCTVSFAAPLEWHSSGDLGKLVDKSRDFFFFFWPNFFLCFKKENNYCQDPQLLVKPPTRNRCGVSTQSMAAQLGPPVPICGGGAVGASHTNDAPFSPPSPHCTWCVCVPAAPRMALHPACSPGGAARPGAQRRAGAGGHGCSVRPRPAPPPASPPAPVPAHTGSSTPTLPSPCLMDESWFVTPPPCFTAEEPGPDGVGSSPMEDLLIEHPSMSVYVTSTLELDAEGPQDDAVG